jgi:hypothetical protein
MPRKLVTVVNRPEIFLVDEEGRVSLIPDSQTLASLGQKWSDVELVSEDDFVRTTTSDRLQRAIAKGEARSTVEVHPSVLQPRRFRDGQLVQGRDGGLYVIKDGARRLIPDLPTASAEGVLPKVKPTGWRAGALVDDSKFDFPPVEVLSDDELFAIPVGRALEPAERVSNYVETDLGAGHFMYTNVSVLGSGHVDATTRTFTVTWFGGFHGAAYALFADAGGIMIGSTGMHRYGVDGRWVGRSDRTDYWADEVGGDIGSRTTSVHVLHTWAPSDIFTILNQWSQLGRSIGEVYAAFSWAGGGA